VKIELRHIAKSFGPVRANDDVSLTIEAGSIHGLLGENGAGKSTLVKVLSGFITRDGGEILFDGQPANVRTPADAMRAGIGMLHQDPLDFPPLTVGENFLAASLGDISLADLRRLTAQFNFDLNPDAFVSDLSVGERQQLEITRLLAMGVKTLVLDEPTTGISASQKSALFAALRLLVAQGKSVIFVSHKLEDVEELCDRATVLRRGQVAGHVEIKAAAGSVAGTSMTNRVVALMFGKELPTPVKPATRREDPALRLNGFVFGDDRLDVRIDDLIVYRGEVIGLAGLEGSGQTHFLEACAGLWPVSAGRIEVGGHDLTRQPYRAHLAAGITYLPADRLRDGLIPGLSIQDHVALRTAGDRLFVDRNATYQAAQKAIETFNIRGRPDSHVERLSGGNQQRAQLALMPPDLTLVLMEHPTRGLDVESAMWIWQQLIARCQGGTTIIFASSDLDEITQYSDRVLVFSGGRVSRPLDAATLSAERLGELIGGKF
jgi:simple sugar transport system ATP-binding protein